MCSGVWDGLGIFLGIGNAAIFADHFTPRF